MADPSERNEQTLFVGNLSHSIKAPEMQAALFEMFSPYGNILDIKLQRREKLTRVGMDKKTKQRYTKGMPYLRCIAFVIYEEKSGAVNAQRLNGIDFFGRKMIVNFAKKKSDIVKLRDGTYKPRVAAAGDPEQGQKILIKKNKPEEEAIEDKAEDEKKIHSFGAPSTTLFVENVGPRANAQLLAPLFEQYPGFSDIKHNVTTMTAFIIFGKTDQAVACLQELHGFKVDPHNQLQISFGRTG